MKKTGTTSSETKAGLLQVFIPGGSMWNYVRHSYDGVLSFGISSENAISGDEIQSYTSRFPEYTFRII